MSMFSDGAFAHAQPVAGFAGGLLIGLAAVIMLLGTGRIAGISGLAARVAGIGTSSAPYPVALAFIVGLPLGTLLVANLAGTVSAHFNAPLGGLIIGGLAVGFGTLLGGGCTSGHGVCGLSRLSPRSIAATITFVGTAMVTVAVMNAMGVS